MIQGMAVRFKLDENLPRDAEVLLRSAGHDVQTVLEERLGGSADPEILDACLTERRILITLDLDFSDIRLYPPVSHHGIWVLRPPTQSIDNTLTLLRGALGVLKSEQSKGRLWIVELGQVRIHD
jgi:predicted nuclease of predicted toxin-antitoxin system